ncbi:hypothetical protein LEP1GSC036_0016 [Leptospira weilii str. 2006001853]|uniref:Uncharacterized protein n=3 Tax=Leptospira weilii TaxID=28184 RepID=A0A828YUU5_9LEPT|nr:hypothetical protein LEP1GSC036_0016 [Leptospira weilii str. 2006001853]EMJ62160.1 hypothetical protein LEP1GSC051_0627 [Leptospira sp. P2653]EMM72761.1 hypothetical protein LEP1GSC038_1842 [Leptospira weilii str. 2006001855]EMN43780.1 hypothetical protein LEP1GSC086_4618 [Leptospira weilii str. LNT 1234]EMY13317.1 hypothetical protein LEP1GSC043_0203 [Leptospira weilii str. Ecochallenge]OMI16981.1 hypothetical protein BUQ74_12840 [Leptospira weilii serovar Heyan]QDK21694.1 hypothetical pr
MQVGGSFFCSENIRAKARTFLFEYFFVYQEICNFIDYIFLYLMSTNEFWNRQTKHSIRSGSSI